MVAVLRAVRGKKGRGDFLPSLSPPKRSTQEFGVFCGGLEQMTRRVAILGRLGNVRAPTRPVLGKSVVRWSWPQKTQYQRERARSRCTVQIMPKKS